MKISGPRPSPFSSSSVIHLQWPFLCIWVRISWVKKFASLSPPFCYSLWLKCKLPETLSIAVIFAVGALVSIVVSWKFLERCRCGAFRLWFFWCSLIWDSREARCCLDTAPPSCLFCIFVTCYISGKLSNQLLIRVGR